MSPATIPPTAPRYRSGPAAAQRTKSGPSSHPTVHRSLVPRRVGVHRSRVALRGAVGPARLYAESGCGWFRVRGEPAEVHRHPGRAPERHVTYDVPGCTRCPWYTEVLRTTAPLTDSDRGRRSDGLPQF